MTTQLASILFGSGDAFSVTEMRFIVVGSRLTIRFGTTEYLSVSDFSLKSGSVGIRSSLQPTLDDFSVKAAS